HPVALTSTKSDARRQSGDYLTMRYGDFRRIRRTIPICVLYRPTSMGMSYKRRLSCGGSGFRFPGTDFLPDGLRGQAFRHDGKLPFDLLSGVLALSLFEIDLREGQMDTWQLRVSLSRTLESADGLVRAPLRAISVRQTLVDARRFGIK